MSLDIELDGFFDGEVSETVTYQPDGDPPIIVQAPVNRLPYEQEHTSNGRYLLKRADILFRASDISEPDMAATVLLDGLEWDIEGYDPVGANVAYSVQIARRERMAKRTK